MKLNAIIIILMENRHMEHRSSNRDQITKVNHLLLKREQKSYFKKFLVAL